MASTDTEMYSGHEVGNDTSFTRSNRSLESPVKGDSISDDGTPFWINKSIIYHRKKYIPETTPRTRIVSAMPFTQNIRSQNSFGPTLSHFEQVVNRNYRAAVRNRRSAINQEADKLANFEPWFRSTRVESGPRLFLFLLDNTVVLEKVLHHFDTESRIFFALTSHGCARIAFSLLPNPNDWKLAATAQQEMYENLRLYHKFLWEYGWCIDCREFTLSDLDISDRCTPCLMEYDLEVRRENGEIDSDDNTIYPSESEQESSEAEEEEEEEEDDDDEMDVDSNSDGSEEQAVAMVPEAEYRDMVFSYQATAA